jgi:hypothetical protein
MAASQTENRGKCGVNLFIKKKAVQEVSTLLSNGWKPIWSLQAGIILRPELAEMIQMKDCLLFVAFKITLTKHMTSLASYFAHNNGNCCFLHFLFRLF